MGLAKISIKHRMLILLIIWLMVYISLGVYASYEMNHLSEITSEVYDYPFTISNAAKNTRLNLLKVHRDMKNMMLQPGEMNYDLYLADVIAAEHEILENLDIIRHGDSCATIRELEPKIRNQYMLYSVKRQEAIDLIIEKGKNAARAAIENNNEIVFELESLLDELEQHVQEHADQLLAHSNQASKNKKTAIIVSMSIIGFIMLGLFYYLKSSVLKSIGIVKNAIEVSAETGELTETHLPGKNEITDIADGYNQLVRKLRELFWLEDGQNMLNRHLDGYMTTKKLADKSLRYLAKRLEAGLGVFYLYNKKMKQLSLAAEYANTESNGFPSIVLLGEGVVGQAALERKPILLTETGDIVIQTGTAAFQPSCIYTFPVHHDGKLYGVMELAFQKPFTPLQAEFLMLASEIIAVKLNNALQNEQIRELLELTEQAHDKLEVTARELREANWSLEEQQQMEEQAELLSQQNQELEQSSQYKSEFLANMSHELRTPLNSIILLSKMLMTDTELALSEQDREKIRVINYSGEALLQLINDILDLSKIESGRAELEKEHFHTGDVIKELRALFSGLAEEKGIKFTIEDNVDRYMYADMNKLLLIIRNFLSNAFKFTEEGEVTFCIHSDQADGKVLFTVTDTGIGISRERLPYIFDEFRQGDGSISRKYGGTGLGLSICRKLADLMDASIEVESDENVGSTFRLIMKGIVTEGAPVSVSGSSNMPIGTRCGKQADLHNTACVFAGKEAEKVILVIEDDTAFAESIKLVNDRLEVQTLIADSGSQGLKLLETNKVDGIILDLGLPDMHGTEVLRRLKSSREWKHIPVHIISAAEKDHLSLQLGAARYLQKPVHEEDIAASIEEIFSGLRGSSEQANAALKGKTILIVDDDLKNLFVLAAALEKQDADILEAENGQAALNILNRQHVDLVIMDIMMPVMDGYEAMRAIRRDPKLRGIPVIALTARSLPGDREKCLEAGANDYIPKPIDYDVLISIVKAWIEKS
jgi:signal transduction histidine kinase/DNA-binding response OmpR family regulator